MESNLPAFKYQLILLGNDLSTFQKIENLLFEKLDDLGVSKESFVILKNLEANQYKGNQPCFIIFSNTLKNFDSRLDSYIQQHQDESNTILPLYSYNFVNEVDTRLHAYNAENRNNIPQIVNYVLEGFNFLRRRRRIFISYKRSDARNFAVQLYDYLESRNYDVFLDTHTVAKATIFQEQLWHEMTDSDVVVLLDTPGFLESKWCREELALAESKRISVLRIEFRKATDDKGGLLGLTYSINVGKINKMKKVKEKILSQIAFGIESLRARSMASRQDTLITEFVQSGKTYGKSVIRHKHNILLYDNTSKYVIIPAIGVPISTDFHMSENIAHKLGVTGDENIYIIYDNVKLLDQWNEHLDWLCSNLKVKSIKKTQFNDWFINH